MQLKILQKNSFKKTAEATGDLIGYKIANKVPKVSNIHNKILQRQSQMSMIKKYLKKDIYLQKKGKKSLMN